MVSDIREITNTVKEEEAILYKIKSEIAKTLVGQDYLVERLLMAMLCNNHVLIEGVPGLAKTLAVTTLAQTMQATFSRIQFTPDLLPADVLGTLIYNPKSGEFTTKKGPIFANIVLADEINRAPAKVQSALLEAMQEKQVTLGDSTYTMSDPFLVLATQNPIDQEGTYPLPEAQVDRFMFKLIVTYPSMSDEKIILKRMATTAKKIEAEAVITPEDIIRLRSIVDQIYIDEKVEDYIVNIIQATRSPEKYGLDIADYLQYGGSPRATIFLAMAARANAMLAGRGYVTPQDVKNVAMDVLRHRVVVTYEAEADEVNSEQIVEQIVNAVKVP